MVTLFMVLAASLTLWACSKPCPELVKRVCLSGEGLPACLEARRLTVRSECADALDDVGGFIAKRSLLVAEPVVIPKAVPLGTESPVVPPPAAAPAAVAVPPAAVAPAADVKPASAVPVAPASSAPSTTAPAPVVR